jgi:trans-aconitate methyltransferase
VKSAQFQIHAALEETHWWFTARRQIVGAVLAALVPPSSDSRIVEIGCGTGANLAALADCYDCLGIDVNQEAVDWAKRRYTDLKFICGADPREARRELPGAKAVLLLDVLEHVRDDYRLLSEIVSDIDAQWPN